jgi:hypothetical protein
MAKRKHYTGDLFAPEQDFAPYTDENRERTASESVIHTHNKHINSIKAALIKGRSAPKKDETKSKRLNLLVRPGVLKQFAKIAYMQQSSVNDLINRLISEYNDKEAATIRQYDRLFKDKS